jgi:hypothetical protein
VKAVASLGVNDAVRMVDPLAAGNQLHFATKGVTSAVASASHPLITTPAAENLILPCALAVPEIKTKYRVSAGKYQRWCGCSKSRHGAN